MARKDFIERENRTTITGIIAIVLIVFLVASFMRVNEIGWFDNNNLVGAATNPESFLGIRHVQLESHDALVGHLEIQGLGKRTYYAYPDEGVLIVDYHTNYVQTVLVEDINSPGIHRGFYDDRMAVRVLLNELTSQLYVDGLTTVTLPPLSLTPMTVYDGEVSVAGELHQLWLVADELLIATPAGQDYVELTDTPEGFVGVWQGRDVTVNAAERLVIINDLY